MNKNHQIGVLIIDSHSLVGTSIASLLGTQKDVTAIGVATTEKEAMELLSKNSVDVVSMDIDFKDRDQGIGLIRDIRNTFPYIRIMILTNLLEEMLLRQTLREGVISYLLKNCSADEFILAIQDAISNKAYFSPDVLRMIIKESSFPIVENISEREEQVLAMICLGKNNKEISQELSISISTVQFHVSNLLRKLNAHNRTEAAFFALSHHLVVVPRDEDRSEFWSSALLGNPVEVVRR